MTRHGTPGSLARLRRIGQPEREARRLRRALEHVLRLHAESAGMLHEMRAEAFDRAAARAREALDQDTNGDSKR